jgi:hypothetical protein
MSDGTAFDARLDALTRQLAAAFDLATVLAIRNDVTALIDSSLAADDRHQHRELRRRARALHSQAGPLPASCSSR